METNNTPTPEVLNAPQPVEAPAAPAPSAPITTSDTIAQVLEKRKAMFAQGPSTPAGPQPEIPEAQPEPEPPQPIATPQEEIDKRVEEQKAKELYELAKTNPEALIKQIQESIKTPEPEGPQPLPLSEYAAHVNNTVQQLVANKPTITLSSLIGQGGVEALEAEDTDFSPALQAFVNGVVAEVMGPVLISNAELQEKLRNQEKEISPMVLDAKANRTSQQIDESVARVFPQAANDAEANAFFMKEWERIGPMFAKELYNDPMSNPEEYVRLITNVATLVAPSYRPQSPASMTPQQPTALPPAPTDVAPNYRNHLGQFAQPQNRPMTSEEHLKLRAKALIEKLNTGVRVNKL